jgi:hypothetical protein
MIMRDILEKLVESTNNRVLGQVLKSKENRLIFDWVMAESNLLPESASISERVWYLMNNKPNPFCQNGEKRTFRSRDRQYGFCNNSAKCQCLRQHQSENHPPVDIKKLLEKRKITWMEKYGVENVGQLQSVKDKRRVTMSQRNYTPVIDKLRKDKRDLGYTQVISRCVDEVAPLFSRDEYHGSNRKHKYPWRCNLCGQHFFGHVDYGTTPKCYSCYPKSISLAENHIAQFIVDLGFKVERNTKSYLSGLELDIVIPEKKIAVEYNGVYWHSDKFKSKTYHVDKMLRCRELGIHLIQIFEDEWNSRPEIVKHRLRNLLGLGDKIGARKTQIVELTTKEYRTFTESYHLGGYAHATVKLGLKFRDELVAVLGMSRSRYTREGYELIRYCSKDTVVGGAGKLLAHFKKLYTPTTIVSYANRCWSDGRLYRALGFRDVTAHQQNVGYWYIKDGKRYHRSNFTKSRLVSLGHPSNLTEAEIMSNLGYHKLYDCGNFKFLWNQGQ